MARFFNYPISVSFYLLDLDCRLVVCFINKILIAVQQNETNNSTTPSAAVNATSSSTASTASTTTTTAPANQQQALVINSQGQIISLPVLQPQGNTATSQTQPAQQQTQVMNSNLNNFNQNTSNANSTSNATQQQTVSLSQINFASLTNNGGVQLQTLNTNRNNTNNVVNVQGQVNGGTPIKTLLEEDDKETDNDLDNDNGPTIANMPAANNLGMPSTRKSLRF